MMVWVSMPVASPPSWIAIAPLLLPDKPLPSSGVGYDIGFDLENLTPCGKEKGKFFRYTNARNERDGCTHLPLGPVLRPIDSCSFIAIVLYASRSYGFAKSGPAGPTLALEQNYSDFN